MQAETSGLPDAIRYGRKEPMQHQSVALTADLTPAPRSFRGPTWRRAAAAVLALSASWGVAGCDKSSEDCNASAAACQACCDAKHGVGKRTGAIEQRRTRMNGTPYDECTCPRPITDEERARHEKRKQQEAAKRAETEASKPAAVRDGLCDASADDCTTCCKWSMGDEARGLLKEGADGKSSCECAAK